MLCTWIAFSAPDIHADTKLHTQSRPPTMEKKKVLLAREAHSSITKANTQKKTPCLSHPKNTQHLNVIAEASQAFIGIDVKRRSHCDTPSVGEGQGGSHGQPPVVRSICVGDAAALGPSACGGDGSLTGAFASMDQLRIRCTCAQKHAWVHTHTHTCMKTNVLP